MTGTMHWVDCQSVRDASCMDELASYTLDVDTRS
jgi:hypothetical protein